MVEMDIRRTRTCERCKNVVPLDKVRLVPKNNEVNLLVCDTCMEELKKVPLTSRITNAQSRLYGEPPRVRITNVAANPPKYTWTSQRVAPLPTPEYAQYICTHCDYVFRVDRAKAGITYGVKCPYCGRPDKLRLHKR
ncbi:hypothetical protein HZC32_02480 [Candidatus Woesearchaeota archaeon]|nr:hypothetical protein [Candidatus Woesearchaeota archaeon]